MELNIDRLTKQYRNKIAVDRFTATFTGGVYGLLGPNGSGKTTLINLLMRFYEVNGGAITIDGITSTDLTRKGLRKNFGMVLQDTWLKHDTVRENIRFGKPEATDEEIRQAAMEAKSWEFIRRLPEGLDTVLNEDSLSQGQKQLLCITRVMLCRPPMLILDEATSSIDTRTEIQIQQAFDRLMEGRTSFIVAHRLSTIRNADRILVMNHGKAAMFDETEKVFARGDELEQMGLRVPQITKIMQILQRDGYPVGSGVLTLEQAIRQLAPLLKSRGCIHAE